MILHCDACNNLHFFSDEEVERLVYTLQGLAWDADRRPPAIVTPSDRPDCLTDLVRLSFDGEGYGEWTDSLVDRREAETGRQGARQ